MCLLLVLVELIFGKALKILLLHGLFVKYNLHVVAWHWQVNVSCSVKTSRNCECHVLVSGKCQHCFSCMQDHHCDKVGKY